MAWLFFRRTLVAAGVIVMLLLSSCQKEEEKPKAETPKPVPGRLVESFEQGEKNDYATADIALASGLWRLENGLIGRTNGDAKRGAAALRLSGTARLSMRFDRQNGAGQVRISHATYQGDPASSWELYFSTDEGLTWRRAGYTVGTSLPQLMTAVFVVNVPGKVRLEVRKLSSVASRLNIDDIEVDEYVIDTRPVRENPLTLGKPSIAPSSTGSLGDYGITREAYALAYSDLTKGPRWVAWHSSPAWRGSYRPPATLPWQGDEALPAAWYKTQAADYAQSGFVMLPLCPWTERTASRSLGETCFRTTNVLPVSRQAQASYEAVENFVLQTLGPGREVYHWSGPIGTGGQGDSGYVNTIGARPIEIPAAIYRIMLILPAGQNDLSRISAETRVIALRIPNTPAALTDWGRYRVSVDAIEQATGLNFFSELEADLQEVLESRTDTGPTN